jgi:hypothetical protein
MATPRIALPAAVAGLALRFLPRSWLAPLGVDDVRDSWRLELGLTIILSLAVLIAQGAFVAWPSIMSAARAFQQKRRKSAQLEKARRMLHSLRPDEREVLLPYILEKKTTRYFDIDDGVVRSLVDRGVLAPAAREADITAFPFNMQAWAREYLDERQELLGGAIPTKKPKYF